MLKTERLRCRQVLLKDAEFLLTLYADPRTSALSPLAPLTDPIEMYARIEQWQRHWQEQGFGPMAIIDQSSQKMIGLGGISLRDFSGEQLPNLWYRLAPDAWGQGFASEFTSAYQAWFHSLFPLLGVHALVQENNLASKRILERLGFVRGDDEGEHGSSLHLILPTTANEQIRSFTSPSKSGADAAYLRPMLHTDLPKVMEIQKHCYGDELQESLACLTAKWHAGPASCFVACIDAEVCAYIFAMPSLQTTLSAWNADQCSPPSSPDCMYLHDLAIAPSARGRKLAARLVETVLALAADLGLEMVQLVAVQSSTRFWQQYGFLPSVATTQHKPSLESFGGDACLMRRAVGN